MPTVATPIMRIAEQRWRHERRPDVTLFPFHVSPLHWVVLCPNKHETTKNARNRKVIQNRTECTRTPVALPPTDPTAKGVFPSRKKVQCGGDEDPFTTLAEAVQLIINGAPLGRRIASAAVTFSRVFPLCCLVGPSHGLRCK